MSELISSHINLKSFWKLWPILGTAFITACGGGSSNSNAAPTAVVAQPIRITGTPILSSAEDELYSFQSRVTNGTGELIFSITNAPPWLRVSTNGLVSGTPRTDADTGIFENITVSVQDMAQNRASLSPFTLEVSAVNDPPVITFSQDAISLDEGQSFNISYQITDEEGDIFTVEASGAEDLIDYEAADGSVSGIVKDIKSVSTDLLQISLSANAETFDFNIPVEVFPINDTGNGKTIFGTETAGRGVHLLVLGDGYTQDETELYIQDAFEVVTKLQEDNGINDHTTAWNVHVVINPSNESGADDDFDIDTVDTFYGAGYNCFDIPRLICANSTTILTTAFSEYPFVDEIALVVNDDRFGGAGGSYAVYSRGETDIVLHELGHTFANLADEYVDEQIADRFLPGYIEGRSANVSNRMNPNEVPWSHWIDDKSNFPTRVGENPGAVGIFAGAFYSSSGFYRPLEDSLMRSNGSVFGVVSSEAWIDQIYEKAGPVTSISPIQENITINQDQSAEFSLETLFDTSVQSISWYINDVLQDEFTDMQNISVSEEAGTYTIRVDVSDKTEKIRKTATHANFSTSWNLTIE